MVVAVAGLRHERLRDARRLRRVGYSLYHFSANRDKLYDQARFIPDHLRQRTLSHAEEAERAESYSLLPLRENPFLERRGG